MRKQIEKIFSLKTFFNAKYCENGITCYLKKPSRLVLQNIHKNWLQSINSKSYQNYSVFLSEQTATKKSKNLPLLHGYIDHCLPSQIKFVDVELTNGNFSTKKKSELNFNIVIPEQEIMQYFIQWQRYRKYWWSSITTTPGLFSVTDMKYDDENMHANISANFKWGQWKVETIKVIQTKNNGGKFPLLCCSMSLEKSLITLLLDATANSTKEEYLRLHNKMAPYKVSFALDYKDQKNASTLQELASQIFYKLQIIKITSWLPNFTLSLEPQIKENLQMGVTYTAILSENNTLSNGIFHLMNSSTMLKEQVHLADFVDYVALLCGQRT